MSKSVKFGWFDWANGYVLAVLILSAFLPCLYGFESPKQYLPPGYDPIHNGFHSNGVGYFVAIGGGLGLVLWLLELVSPALLRVFLRTGQVALGGATLWLVKLWASDFKHYYEYEILFGFWVLLSALLIWLGVSIIRLGLSVVRVVKPSYNYSIPTNQ